MRSSARNLVNSVSPIGSGSSTRLTARRSSLGVTRTGGFTLRWRLPGALRSRSSPLLRCDAAGGRPEAAVLSSRPGHARRPNRSASKSAPFRCWLMLGSMLWTTRPEPVSHRVRPAHPQAPSRSSSLFVAKSMPSWRSAATSGITRHGFFSSRKRAAVSPIEPEDMRAIKAVACTPTPTCTVSCSPRFNTRRAPDRRAWVALSRPALRSCLQSRTRTDWLLMEHVVQALSWLNIRATRNSDAKRGLMSRNSRIGRPFWCIS